MCALRWKTLPKKNPSSPSLPRRRYATCKREDKKKTQVACCVMQASLGRRSSNSKRRSAITTSKRGRSRQSNHVDQLELRCEAAAEAVVLLGPATRSSNPLNNDAQPQVINVRPE